jgi:two-component system, cell cycle response regulator CpdR
MLDAVAVQEKSTFPRQHSAMAKLLIVEDDESVRTLAARALERAGHMIDIAADGAQGLALIHAARGGYDLVVSDIRMPGMDGIQMAKAAASLFPAMKILLMTGYADQRERAEELNGVIVDVVQKPFTLAEIRARVEQALACFA